MLQINLKGRHAIICGATDGIGKAVAFVLASAGASVTLMARNEEKLSSTLQEINHLYFSKKNSYLVADFSLPEVVKTKIEEYVEKGGEADILVNNTGGPAPGLAIDANTTDFYQAFSSHLICNQILTQALFPQMKEKGFGRIVNIISTSVKEPIFGLGVSNTIRAAVANWAKTLSMELAPFEITVNNILPGATETGRLKNIIKNRAKRNNVTENEAKQEMLEEVPAGRFAQPEEIAYAVAFLCSPLASYITGVNLPVEGGRLKCL